MSPRKVLTITLSTIFSVLVFVLASIACYRLHRKKQISRMQARESHCRLRPPVESWIGNRLGTSRRTSNADSNILNDSRHLSLSEELDSARSSEGHFPIRQVEFLPEVFPSVNLRHESSRYVETGIGASSNPDRYMMPPRQHRKKTSVSTGVNPHFSLPRQIPYKELPKIRIYDDLNHHSSVDLCSAGREDKESMTTIIPLESPEEADPPPLPSLQDAISLGIHPVGRVTTTVLAGIAVRTEHAEEAITSTSHGSTQSPSTPVDNIDTFIDLPVLPEAASQMRRKTSQLRENARTSLRTVSPGPRSFHIPPSDQNQVDISL